MGIARSKVISFFLLLFLKLFGGFRGSSGSFTQSSNLSLVSDFHPPKDVKSFQVKFLFSGNLRTARAKTRPARATSSRPKRLAFAFQGAGAQLPRPRGAAAAAGAAEGVESAPGGGSRRGFLVASLRGSLKGGEKKANLRFLVWCRSRRGVGASIRVGWVVCSPYGQLVGTSKSGNSTATEGAL